MARLFCSDLYKFLPGTSLFRPAPTPSPAVSHKRHFPTVWLSRLPTQMASSMCSGKSCYMKIRNAANSFFE